MPGSFRKLLGAGDALTGPEALVCGGSGRAGHSPAELHLLGDTLLFLLGPLVRRQEASGNAVVAMLQVG